MFVKKRMDGRKVLQKKVGEDIGGKEKEGK